MRLEKSFEEQITSNQQITDLREILKQANTHLAVLSNLEQRYKDAIAKFQSDQ